MPVSAVLRSRHLPALTCRRALAGVAAAVTAAALTVAGGAHATVTSGVAIPYGATGWAVLQAGNNGSALTGNEDAAFASPGFDDSTWVRAQAPFGTSNSRAGGSEGLAEVTAWPIGTDLLLRHDAPVPAGAGTVHVHGSVDNDANVYFNGTLVTSSTNENGSSDTINADVPANVVNPGGTNVVAVRARDRGGLDYVDVQVTCDICSAPPADSGDAVDSFATAANPATGHGATGPWSYAVGAMHQNATTGDYSLPMTNLDSFARLDALGSCYSGTVEWYLSTTGCNGGGGVIAPPGTHTVLVAASAADPGLIDLSLNSSAEAPAVIWTAPSTTASNQWVHVTGAVRPADGNTAAGNRQWALVLTGPLGSGSGTVLDHGTMTNADAPHALDVTWQVSAGWRIFFVVGAGPDGSYYYDNTDLVLRITPTTVTAPDAPTNVQATGGDGQVSLTWTPPANDGGAPIRGYLVNVYAGTDTTAAPVDEQQVTPGSATSYTELGLTNGTLYTFTVSAANISAFSAESTPVHATPTAAGGGGGGTSTTPDAPTHLAATSGDAQVSLSWDAPTNDGGASVTGYQVNVYTASTATGTPAATTTATGTAATVTGLSNGQSYLFTVAAVNSNGTGTPSAAVPATPSTTPGAPTTLTAAAGDGQVTLSWGAPTSDGGSPITGYRIAEYTGTTATGTGTVLTPDITGLATTVTGLTNGQAYTFTVAAVNGNGPGGDGTVTSTPFTTPSAPTAPTASTASKNTVTLSWTDGADGGLRVTNHQVQAFTVKQAKHGGGVTYTLTKTVTTNSSATTCTVSGLNAKMQYEFTVAESTAAGWSSYSGYSTPVAG